MGFSWRGVTASSLLFGYVLTYHTPGWTKVPLFLVFLAAWMLQLLAFAVYTMFIWPWFLSPLRGLPEPKGNSLFMGQGFRIMKEDSGVPHIEWTNTIPNDGIIRYLGLFNQERIFLTSPKALSEVLVTKNYDFQKPEAVRWSIGRLLGIGVLLAEGDEHKAQRKSLMPAFSFRHIKNIYPVFWTKSREVVLAMAKEIEQEVAAAEPVPRPPSERPKLPQPQQKQEVDEENNDPAAIKIVPLEKGEAYMEAGQWASRATLDIIGVAGLGRDFKSIEDPSNKLSQTYQHLFKPSKQAQYLGLLSLLIPGWVVNMIPVSRNEDVNRAAQLIRAECRSLIQTKKQRLAARSSAEKETAAAGGTGPNIDVDILSVALESGSFTDENLVDQLMTFLAAGHETTASAMTWALYLLCRFPDVQRRLRAEIRECLPSITDEQSTVSAPAIDRLVYLNAVCQEVLRYYSPVPLTFREAARDTTVLGRRVPKGTRVIMGVWANNRSVDMWGPTALEFDPERWMPCRDGRDGRPAASSASGGAASNFAFMTFLHGPRSCIGQSFALAEFKVLLAAWVGQFEFSLKHANEYEEKNMPIKGGVTARPAKGLMVKARVVEGW